MAVISPAAFCLTKAGAIAGESLAGILGRKEKERLCGKGVFWWGVGENKADALEIARTKYGVCEVLFDFPAKERPDPDGTKKKRLTVENRALANKVLVWRAYADPDTKRQKTLPRHVLVTSGALTQTGKRKKTYYALVCRSAHRLHRSAATTIYSGMYSNLRKDGSFGSGGEGSQSTLVRVRHPSDPINIHYEAKLSDPYFVTLLDPKLVPKWKICRFNILISRRCSRRQWLAEVAKLRA